MTLPILKYYYDLTRYNLGFSLLIGYISKHLTLGILAFGTFGMPIGLFCYKYYQNNQYYFYLNLGIKKSKLILIAWTANAILALIGFWAIK